MKKLFAFVLSFAMVLALAACGGSSEETAAEGAGESETEGGAAVSAAEGFTFSSGEVEIAMNAPAADIIAALGEPVSYFEEESCAFKGLDKTYTYANFIIYTYPVDEVDYISELDIINDLEETAEGIGIGASADEVKAAYGEPELKGTAYSYTRGDSELQFLFTGDNVSSIQYFANTGLK